MTHERIVRPASLGGARAEAVYRSIRDTLRRGYAQSSDPVTLAYQRWRRLNAFPYRSAVHGERFVNNYANDAARDYGRPDESGPLPEGAMIAKDSFTVTEAGNVVAGPLFLMEKKQPGFDPATGDWLFMMISPDGATGAGSWTANTDDVGFCGRCHNTAPAGQDRLFFVPPRGRPAGR